MADELAEKIAEAKKKMFGSQLSGGKVIILVKGEARVSSADKNVEIRKA